MYIGLHFHPPKELKISAIHIQVIIIHFCLPQLWALGNRDVKALMNSGHPHPDFLIAMMGPKEPFTLVVH